MIKAFFHIIIALSVFFSSGGFWVNSHFCRGELTSTSFFLSFGSCCAANMDAPCSAEKESCSAEGHDEDKNCCKNKPDFFKLEQNQDIQKIAFKPFEIKTSLNAILTKFDYSLSALKNNYLPYFNYHSPFIVIDRQVRLQTFLC